MGNVADAVPETRHSAHARVALIVMGLLVPNAVDSPTENVGYSVPIDVK